MRALERQGQFFTALLIGLFAIPPAAILIGMASERTFWVSMLSWAGAWVLIAVLQGPLRSLGRVPRFVGWFCVGVTATALYAFSRGEAFNFAVAAGMGLMLGIIEILTDWYRARVAAKRG